MPCVVCSAVCSVQCAVQCVVCSVWAVQGLAAGERAGWLSWLLLEAGRSGIAGIMIHQTLRWHKDWA